MHNLIREMNFLFMFAGSLGTSVFDTDVYLVGASGGVYALLAAHLANVLLNYNNMEFGIVRLIGIFVIGKISNKIYVFDIFFPYHFRYYTDREIRLSKREGYIIFKKNKDRKTSYVSLKSYIESFQAIRIKLSKNEKCEKSFQTSNLVFSTDLMSFWTFS